MSELENNKNLARSFIDAVNRNDTQWILDNYADDVLVWTMGNTLISGKYNKGQVAEFASRILDSFPEGITFTIVGITAEGDRVAMETESIGQHVSGKRYNNFYHMLFTFRDGKITMLKEYLDTELVTEVLCGGERPA